MFIIFNLISSSQLNIYMELNIYCKKICNLFKFAFNFCLISFLPTKNIVFQL